MPQLETRRIYVAGRSLAITLPPGWLRYLGLRAGDRVEVVVDEDIVIRPIQTVKRDESEILG